MRLIRSKKRLAIAEITGTLIMVAITLVAGAAVFGWINGQAGTSESAYGQSVASNVNFLNERFVEVSQSYSGAGTGGVCSGGPPAQCTGASFWLYNNGQVGFTLYSLKIVSQNPSYPMNILFYSVCTASTSNCGFVMYNQAGTSVVCSNNAGGTPPPPNGIYQNNGVNNIVPALLLQNQLSQYPYQITMPTAVTCSAGAQYLYDGVAYTFTFTGLYGNIIQTTLTVNG